MLRQFIVLLVSLLCLALGPAWGADRGALFKVSGNGHTMHLFGTIHVGLPQFYPLEPRIAAAIAGASTLALEIDPLQDPAAMTAALQKHAMLGSDNAGYKALPAAFRKRLERVLAQAHIDMAAIERYKPWLVATTLALAEYQAQGYRADLSVDLQLAQMARAGKVPVIELESAGAQLAMFDRLSEEAQWHFLQESVALIESGRQSAEVRQIVEAWSRADRAALDAIALQAENDTSVSGKFVQQVLLAERNGPMADKLMHLLGRTNNSVAAMGVLHLLGKNSVPELLRARGLQVERIY